MLERKLVKHQKRENLNEPDLWMLGDIERIKPSKYYHEIAKGDLYVAYRECDEWYNEIPIGEGLRSDCSMDYKGVRVHFEVDLGSEPMDDLFNKIENYIRHCPSGDKTIFVLRDGVRRTARTTGNNLYAYLIDRKRGRQFSWTLLDMLKKDPFGEWLFNPLQDEPLTLDDLCSGS